MAAFNFFNAFKENLAEKVHDFASDTFKVMLTNSAPAAANTVKTDITEISAGNGYTAGGATVMVTSSSQSGGTFSWVIQNIVWTATGAVGPFRYAVLYNDTATNDPLIGWSDRGSALTLANGDTVTLSWTAVSGVAITLT